MLLMLMIGQKSRNRKKNQMTKQQEMVLEFHLKFGAYTQDLPHIPSPLTLLRRVRLISEEDAEFAGAAAKGDLANMAKELCDIHYVVDGAALALGIDLESCFREVHRSNMTKVATRDAGGKIIKGDNFEPANIAPIIIAQMGQVKSKMFR